MKAAALLLALCACGGGAKTLRVPEFAPGKGFAEVHDETTTTKSEVHQEATTLTSVMTQHRRWHRKVLEVEGALVSRIAVTYDVDETVSTDAYGVQATTPGPLAGKSYVMWRENDALEAEHADGSPITADERSVLNTEFHRLGTTSRTSAFVTGRSWDRDHSVPLDKDVIEEFALGDDADVRDATMMWMGDDTFHVVMTYSSEGWEVQRTTDARFDRATGRGVAVDGVSLARTEYSGYDVVQTTTFHATIEVE